MGVVRLAVDEEILRSDLSEGEGVNLSVSEFVIDEEERLEGPPELKEADLLATWCAVVETKMLESFPGTEDRGVWLGVVRLSVDEETLLDDLCEWEGVNLPIAGLAIDEEEMLVEYFDLNVVDLPIARSVSAEEGLLESFGTVDDEVTTDIEAV